MLHPRSYKSYADDLKQLADSLGVRQFFVIGVSGGGPYTYAAAALLPERVLGVMTISTLAQAGAPTDPVISSWSSPAGLIDMQTFAKGQATHKPRAGTIVGIHQARNHLLLPCSRSCETFLTSSAYAQSPAELPHKRLAGPHAVPCLLCMQVTAKKDGNAFTQCLHMMPSTHKHITPS